MINKQSLFCFRRLWISQIFRLCFTTLSHAHIFSFFGVGWKRTIGWSKSIFILHVCSHFQCEFMLSECQRISMMRVDQVIFGSNYDILMYIEPSCWFANQICIICWKIEINRQWLALIQSNHGKSPLWSHISAITDSSFVKWLASGRTLDNGFAFRLAFYRCKYLRFGYSLSACCLDKTKAITATKLNVVWDFGWWVHWAAHQRAPCLFVFVLKACKYALIEFVNSFDMSLLVWFNDSVKTICECVHWPAHIVFFSRFWIARFTHLKSAV